jgi:hypothetical protein
VEAQARPLQSSSMAEPWREPVTRQLAELSHVVRATCYAPLRVDDVHFCTTVVPCLGVAPPFLTAGVLPRRKLIDLYIQGDARPLDAAMRLPKSCVPCAGLSTWAMKARSAIGLAETLGHATSSILLEGAATSTGTPTPKDRTPTAPRGVLPKRKDPCADGGMPARLDFAITCGASSSDSTAGTPVVQPKWTTDEDELRAGLSKRVRHSAGGESPTHSLPGGASGDSVKEVN